MMSQICTIIDIANWSSIIGGIISIAGLIVSAISLWKVGKVKVAVKEVEQSTKIKINNIINLTFIVETTYHIKLLQEKIGHKEWDMTAYIMSEVHMKLSEILSKSELMEMARPGFRSDITKLGVTLSEFRNTTGNYNATKLKGINTTLNSIIENLKLIEGKIKE